MNSKYLTSLIILAFSAICANALVPKVDLHPCWIRVRDVERTDSATRIKVRFQYFPGSWVCLSSGTSLISDCDHSNIYRIVGTENIELNQKITMPETGYHDAVLLFEKIPDFVKVVDMVESNIDDLQNNVLGIHLDEPENRIRPKTLTMNNIWESVKKYDNQWTGLDYLRYSDLSFLDKGGQVHIKGNITDYSPRCGFSTVSIMTYDDITNRKFPHMVKITPDGNFELDVQVRYPQFSAMDFGSSKDNMFLIPDGLQRQYLFLNPGDTISISTCLASRFDKNRGLVPEYFGFEGKPTESAIISLLADSLINQRYGLNSLYFKHYVSESALMERNTIEATENLCNLLDSVVADLPKLLKDIPVSGYAKDILSTYAVGQIELLMEDLEMHLRLIRGPKLISSENGTTTFTAGHKYDINAIVAPKLRHKTLLFDNPLILCLSGILINRWENNLLLNPAKLAGEGIMESSEVGKFHGTNNFSEPFAVLNNHLESTGIGNCFAVQVLQSNSYISHLHAPVGPIPFELERNSKLLPYILKCNTYDKLNTIVMNEYNDFVKETSSLETSSDNKSDQAIVLEETLEEDILEKIISPYRGNVLFLDFWGMSCAPCRANMIKQKPILEEFADKPFRVLYIASIKDGINTCTTWLRSQGIKGEHIFVSPSDWKRLNRRLNFNKIPFGLLIGKDGIILETDFNSLSIDNPIIHQALSKPIY